MTTIPAVKLGQSVTYVATNGKAKMALVLGTPETIAEGTSVPTLTEGQLHLLVFSPTGNAYTRHNVPFADTAPADFEVEGTQVNVWRES